MQTMANTCISIETHVLGSHQAGVEQREARMVISSTSTVAISIHAVSPLSGVGAGGV